MKDIREIFLFSILFVFCSLIITLIITINKYIWLISTEYENKQTIDYFFVENHPFLMTALLLINGFCEKY